MLTFETPGPVDVVIDVMGATVNLRTGEPGSTTVDVRAHNAARSGDVELMRSTTVDLSGDRLTIRTPRGKRRWRTLIGPGGDRVDLDVVLPAGSTLEMRGWGEITARGELGAVDIDSGMGDIHLDRVAGVRARTSFGDVRVGDAGGPAELRTACGTVHVEHARGDVTAKSSAGDIRIEHGEGELRLSTSAGDVRVHRASAGVEATTSAGDVRLSSVRRGSVTASTKYGLLEIGVAHGTAAWLDVQARHGLVRSELEATDGPGDAELTVEIRATTGYGDIVLRRAG